ncbi:unnamed protein product [Medioppia subpectinata]|uniref:Uncharacterized protein n=1 Tax=Medioppia subpectinata TaxID=1979941 RepID=A0A7R9L6T1_9ACAR|nr:unnamed protein product [Medioppia subpectinata]CAG2115340.1 unnamed protein product [Medioppia subpectinata]
MMSQILKPKPVNSQSSQSSSLSEESDRKCRELCEEMSALKASNESEVKALKVQLNTALDSMQTMTEEKESLRQQLITSEKSNQELVTELSESSVQKSCLTQEISDLKARNETEVQALKVELKTSLESMETMVTENNNLKQTVYTLSTLVSNLSNQNMATDLKHKLCEMSTKISELIEELSALNTSKHIIESDVNTLTQEINAKNIRHSVSDSSSSCSSIGSHNQLTTNSDKTRDETNSGEYETLMAEHKSLRKRYSDLVVTHEEYVSALESAQEESHTYRKCLEKSTRELDVVIIQMNGLKQQCTQAVRQWDKALREVNDLKEQLTRCEHQRNEYMKEIKAAKEMTRLADEVNAGHQKCSSIMSERDSVRKECDDLREGQQTLVTKTRQMEVEMKTFIDEIQSLKREISSAMAATSARSPPHWPSGHEYRHSYPSAHSWAKRVSTTSAPLVLSPANSPVCPDTSDPTFKSSGDTIDKPSAELASLRKQVVRLQTELREAHNEVEVCRRRRDWAFDERDKMKALVTENEISLTALKGIRQSVEDSDDSESVASVGTHSK